MVLGHKTADYTVCRTRTLWLSSLTGFPDLFILLLCMYAWTYGVGYARLCASTEARRELWVSSPSLSTYSFGDGASP